MEEEVFRSITPHAEIAGAGGEAKTATQLTHKYLRERDFIMKVNTLKYALASALQFISREREELDNALSWEVRSENPEMEKRLESLTQCQRALEDSLDWVQSASTVLDSTLSPGGASLHSPSTPPHDGPSPAGTPAAPE